MVPSLTVWRPDPCSDPAPNLLCNKEQVSSPLWACFSICKTGRCSGPVAQNWGGHEKDQGSLPPKPLLSHVPNQESAHVCTLCKSTRVIWDTHFCCPGSWIFPSPTFCIASSFPDHARIALQSSCTTGTPQRSTERVTAPLVTQQTEQGLKR